MNLYILKRKHIPDYCYDMAESFIVRAKSPKNARRICSNNAGDEGANIWLFAKHSTCRKLKADGKEEMLIREYNAA